MMFSGIDLVEIARIEKAMQNPRFLEKYFGKNELKEFEKKNFKAESVAAAFAAKEAFSKVVKSGLSAFLLCEVELLHENSGAPYLLLSGKAKELAKELLFTVSITHTKELAQAIVIGYTKE